MTTTSEIDLRELQELIGTGFRQLDQKIDRGFEQLEERVNQKIDTSLQQLEERVNQKINKDLQQLEERVNQKIDTSLQQLEERVNYKMEVGFQQLDHKFDKRFEQLEKTMEVGIVELKGEIKRLDEQVGSINRCVETLETSQKSQIWALIGILGATVWGLTSKILFFSGNP